MSIRKVPNDYKFTTMTDDSYYNRDTKSIMHYKSLLDIWNDDLMKRIDESMPAVVYGGVNEAEVGVIQDPAGSAIGAELPIGGGASGAIYNTFDLNPIPWIEEGECIFNSIKGEGRRVLHTHSPVLEGSPHNHDDRIAAILDLANAYYNAIVMFNERAGELGDDGKLLNLVPVSASIYAGRFLRREFGNGHLDVSFTFASIAIALGKLLIDGVEIPRMNIYFYDRKVYEKAKEYMAIK
jgi:hypothetical protein